jgi:26S proteasome regulatory subunit T3
MLTGNFIEMVD